MDDATARHLADEIADLRRRLAALETAPRASHTAVRGGQTRWFPDDSTDNPHIYLGPLDGSDPDIGLWVIDGDGALAAFIGTTTAGEGVIQTLPDASLNVMNPDGTGFALLTVGGVMQRPLISCAWQFDPARTQDGQGRAQHSSGTYTRCFTSVLPICSGEIQSSVIVALGAGVTSVDARIRARPWPSGGAVQTVYEETGITGSVFLGGLPWAIPDSINTPAANPIGTLVLLEIETRVASGAGNVLCAPDTPVFNWPA